MPIPTEELHEPGRVSGERTAPCAGGEARLGEPEQGGRPRIGQRGWTRKLWLWSAALTCPCHLPILLALTAGTAVGSFLSAYATPAFVAVLVYFLLALALGLRRPGQESQPGQPR